MKGVHPLISFVLIIALILVSIVTFLQVVKPVIDSFQESVVFSEAKSNLALLDRAIREVVVEGRGAQRVVPLSVRDGSYRVNLEAELLNLACFQKLV